MNRRLLRRFLELYPFQPATAVWRAVEVDALSRVDMPHGRGLDLGCGDGRLTGVVATEAGGRRFVGIDVDPLETALAGQDHTLYERVHTTSAAVIPEAEASFDFVLSVSVMEHIDRLEPVLSEVARVLKPRGRLIVTVPSVGFHRCLRGPLLPGASRVEYLRALDRRLAHLRYWSIDEWRRKLAAAGLQLVDVTPILSRRDIRRWETISRITAGVLHAVAGRKPPIEIQRSLGLRRAGTRMPSPLAAMLGWVLSLGLNDGRPAREEDSGCLLLVAARA